MNLLIQFIIALSLYCVLNFLKSDNDSKVCMLSSAGEKLIPILDKLLSNTFTCQGIK